MFTSWPAPSIRPLECVCSQGMMDELSATQAHGLSFWQNERTRGRSGLYINNFSPSTPMCFYCSLLFPLTKTSCGNNYLDGTSYEMIYLRISYENSAVHRSQTAQRINQAPVRVSWCRNYSLLSLKVKNSISRLFPIMLEHPGASQ